MTSLIVPQITYTPVDEWNWWWKEDEIISNSISVIRSTIDISPKNQLLKNWFEEKWRKLSIREDDIEIVGDVVTVKIDWYKNLVFDPNEYKNGGQSWADNINKFSLEDIQKLFEILGWDDSSGIWSLWIDSTVFLKQLLLLESDCFYWLSTASLEQWSYYFLFISYEWQASIDYTDDFTGGSSISLKT